MAGLNTELFNHFENEFFIPGLEAVEIDLEELHLPPGKSIAQCILAFDLSPTTEAMTMKAYFFPMLRAIRLGLDSHRVLFDAILRADRKLQVAKPLNLLDKSVCELPKERKYAAHMITFDCTDPRSAHTKVYTRSYQVSVNNICDMFTLGGQPTDPAMLKGLEILKDILPICLRWRGIMQRTAF